ncbi:MAG: response regulator, partial [Thermodesulfobacteriota bacterium]
LTLFEEKRPDAVTVDLLMPEMEGLELIERLRKIQPDIKIMVISADIQEMTKKKVIEAGAAAFIPKLERSNEILSTIRSLFIKPAPFEFTETQKEAFTEMMNIAMGQAARALEQILNRWVHLMIPKVQVMKADELGHFFEKHAPMIGALIIQKFDGDVTGKTSLVFPKNYAEILIRNLLGEFKDLQKLTLAEQSALIEVGNIVLNAAVSTLGDVMKTRLKLKFPKLHLNIGAESITQILLNMIPNSDNAVVLLNRLTIGEITVSCYLIFILTESGIMNLVHSLEGKRT